MPYNSIYPSEKSTFEIHEKAIPCSKKEVMLINIYYFHVCVLTLRKEKEMGITKPKQRLTSRCELYPLIVMVDTTEYIYKLGAFGFSAFLFGIYA